VEFQLAPASTAVTATFIAIVAFILAMALLFIWIAWASSRMSVAVENGELHVRVPMYGRSIALAHVDLANASVVDLDASSRLRPRTRTNGIGLPGYGVGWFKLSNGAKALLAVTDRKHVLHLPTREGFDLLVSVREPRLVLEQLRSASDSDGD
jgi:hypothetical protein